MREIKFRVYFPKTKKMMAWSEFVGLYISTIFQKDSEFQRLMQFTGILDLNGQEVYEDDIVKVNINVMTSGHPSTGDDEWIDNDYYAVVKYQPQRGFFGKVFKAIDLLDNQKVTLPRHIRLASYRTEIIGNIYENPELLTK